jgi:hypothetical protein
MAPTQEDKGTRGAYFRPEAWQRYLQNRNRAVLLQHLHPRLFVCLWLAVALLMGAGLAVLGMRIPVRAPGFLLANPSGRDTAREWWVVLPSLRPEEVTAGQSLVLHLGGSGGSVRAPILRVEPAPLEPAALQARFGLAGTALAQPVVLVSARLEAVPEELAEASRRGGLHPVQVEVGPQRLLSLLPVIGHLFPV